MKRLKAVVILFIIFSIVYGQDPEFSYDFTSNHAFLNPAYSSKPTYITFNLTAVREWVYPNAPEHSSFWFSTKGQHMGIGFQIAMSKEAQFYKMMMGGAYFYDLMLSWSSKTHLSMGVAGGIFQDYLNLDQVFTLYPDPLLQDQKKFSRFYPQIATGAMIYNDFFEFGIAGQRLLPTSGYFWGEKHIILPPVLVVHGAYFYKHPIELYDLTSEFAAFLCKKYVYLRPNFTIYLKKIFKVGAGVSGKYLLESKTGRLNLHLNTGIRIGGNFYISYEATLYSVFSTIPAIAKLGNTISIRYDFYPYEKDVPRFF